MIQQDSRTPNHLEKETSLYLREHMYNPVDWYPWKEEALEKAKTENKLIFLSIGYSSCHWCHVMAHESFENEEVAEILNKNFVSIKIDREERPDLDQVYQNVVQLMGRNGGWPLSVFLTPEGKPFFAGTYFPIESRHGMISFPDLLFRLIELYKNRSAHVNVSADQIVIALKKISESPQNGRKITKDDLTDDFFTESLVRIEKSFDETFGGFGTAPKFPNFPVLMFLMREITEHNGIKSEYIENLKLKIIKTLDGMAEGGIYDHLGGGFHRYSVDQQWLVPHFEKMLYDNAMALIAYSEAYRIFKKPRYKEILKEITNYLFLEMLEGGYGFYSAQDADSEGEEGKYFVWTKEELDNIIPEIDRDLFYYAYGVTKKGNFEHGTNILHRIFTNEEISKKFNIDLETVVSNLASIRNNLFNIRNKRIHPNTDDKILTSWNSLLVHGLFSAYRILKDEKVRKISHEVLRCIRILLYDENKSELYAVYDVKTDTVKNVGNLDDYAYYIQALFDDYLVYQEESTLEFIIKLINDVNRQFYDADNGGYFYSSSLKSDVLIRMKKTGDYPIPGPNSIMAENLLQMHYFTGEKEYISKAEEILVNLASQAKKYPNGYGTYFLALQWYLYGSTDLAGSAEDFDFIDSFYIPRLHIVSSNSRKSSIPSIKDTTPYELKNSFVLCHKFNCLPPIKSKNDLLIKLDELFIKL